MLDPVFSGYAWETSAWRAHGCGKLERLSDCQVREMFIYFPIVYEFAFELFSHDFMRDA
jgi:hypothetical protein